MPSPVAGDAEVDHRAAVHAPRRAHPELSAIIIHVDEGIDDHQAMTPRAGHLGTTISASSASRIPNTSDIVLPTLPPLHTNQPGRGDSNGAGRAAACNDPGLIETTEAAA